MVWGNTRVCDYTQNMFLNHALLVIKEGAFLEVTPLKTVCLKLSSNCKHLAVYMQHL